MFDFDVHATNDVNLLLTAKYVDRLIESNGFNTFMYSFQVRTGETAEHVEFGHVREVILKANKQLKK